VCDRAVEEGDPAAWQLVLAAWAAYREWVGKVLGLCGLLAECISAEQVLAVCRATQIAPIVSCRVPTASAQHDKMRPAAMIKHAHVCYGC